VTGYTIRESAMDERERFDAQREASRETLGRVDRSTRERMWEGLTKYLAAEARHARRTAAAEKQPAEQKSPGEKDQDRRSP
jgi:hypothetical protein